MRPRSREPRSTMPRSSTINGAPVRARERRLEVGGSSSTRSRSYSGPEGSASRRVDEHDAPRRDRPVEVRDARRDRAALRLGPDCAAVDRRCGREVLAGPNLARATRRDCARSSLFFVETSSSTRQARRSGGVLRWAISTSAARRPRAVRRASSAVDRLQQASDRHRMWRFPELRPGESCPCPEGRRARPLGGLRVSRSRLRSRLRPIGRVHEAVPRAGLREDVAAVAPGRPRACDGAARRRRGGSSTPSDMRAPRPRGGSPCASAAFPRSEPAREAARTRAASGGRARRASSPSASRGRRRARRSSSVGSAVGPARRSAARRRASSSPIANGFVT